jgi:copper chaperone CopZ
MAISMIAYMADYGIGCPRCAMRIRNGLLSLDGVLLAEVNLENRFAAAAIDPCRQS